MPEIFELIFVVLAPENPPGVPFPVATLIFVGFIGSLEAFEVGGLIFGILKVLGTDGAGVLGIVDVVEVENVGVAISYMLAPSCPGAYPPPVTNTRLLSNVCNLFLKAINFWT